MNLLEPVHLLPGKPGVPDIFVAAVVVHERVTVAGKGIAPSRLWPVLVGNHNIQGRGSAQTLVNHQHTLVNFRAGFEIVDKAVFHRQPGQTHHTQHRQYTGANQHATAVVFGQSRPGIGERGSVRADPGVHRRWQQCQQHRKHQETDHKGGSQSHGHHPAEINHRADVAEGQ